MDLSTLSKPRTIAAIALSVLSLTALGSAIRFDYRRRHDPVFRQKLSTSLRSFSLYHNAHEMRCARQGSETGGEERSGGQSGGHEGIISDAYSRPYCYS